MSRPERPVGMRLPFLAILDREPVGIAVWEQPDEAPDLRLVYANPAFGALKPIGPMPARLTSETWPELAESVTPRLLQVLETGVPWGEQDFALDVETAPGVTETRRFTFEICRLDFDGDRYLLITTTETTGQVERRDALRESEQRYRLLFANMLDGYAYCTMLFDDEGRPSDFVYLDVNPSFERLTGLGQVVGKRVTEVIPGIKESNPELFEVYGRVVRTGRPETLETELPQLHRTLSVAAYRPHPGHFVAVFDDITLRKKAEAEREETLRALKVKDRWIRQAYSDVLDAVTGGRLLILGGDELDAAVIPGAGSPYEIREAGRLGAARAQAARLIGDVPELNELLIAFSEGVTNMLKHAGGGTYRVCKDAHRVQFVLQDNGPGIDFRNLPKAALVPGFSTKQTLGLGFTLMMELTDRLLLCTDGGGTTLLLERNLAEAGQPSGAQA